VQPGASQVDATTEPRATVITAAAFRQLRVAVAAVW
jgi:hypothetical protein